jgi:hypothetical protein
VQASAGKHTASIQEAVVAAQLAGGTRRRLQQKRALMPRQLEWQVVPLPVARNQQLQQQPALLLLSQAIVQADHLMQALRNAFNSIS